MLTRLNLKQQIIGCYTISRKDIRRNLRIWKQTLLPPAIVSMLYFIIFGHVIGQRIGAMHGYPYSEFIAPGLIMMAVIVNSYTNATTFLFMAKFDRSLEEILVSPLSPLFILLGFMIGGVYRGVVVGILVSVVATLFAHLMIYSFCMVIFVGILAACMFSLAGVINAVFAKKFDDVNIVPTFILSPLTYLGGVFYSVTLLPTFWQHISLFNPIVYIINSFRYGFLGVSDSPIGLALFIMLAITGLLFLVAYYLIKTGYGISE